jgi:hypothetical protein
MDKSVIVAEVSLNLRSRFSGAGQLHTMGKDLNMVPLVSCFTCDYRCHAKLLILVATPPFRMYLYPEAMQRVAITLL